jgi:hypothetical protein
MDQIAARHIGADTQSSSMELCMDTPELLGQCEAGYTCAYMNTISWRTPTTPLPMEDRPRVVFERLFGDNENTTPEVRLRQLAQDRSILLSNYAWSRLSNFDVIAMWDGLYNQGDEEYFARRNQAFVGRCETMFDVGVEANKADGNGTPVTSTLETGFFELGRPGLKVLKSLWAGYSLEDYATDNPTILVSYITTPEEMSYAALGTLPEQAAYDRTRLQIGGRAHGIGLKFVKTAAGDFRGYDLNIEVNYLEDSKRT